MRGDLPAGTVTFLFTDIEGSTRLLEELGERYVDALAEQRRIVREALARHGGVEVDTQGDAFFIAFPDARGAAAAAAETQAELATGPVRVRMGLHIGEPIVWAEGYAGMDVHRAARICAAAHGGQVVVSERAASFLDADELRPLGSHRLKDLSAPQPLFQLGDGQFPPLRTLHATNLPAQPSPLIGRRRELDETTALLGNGTRLLTLTGPGGSGKTRLALQVAAELAESFPDGVFWVPLAGVSESELVVPTVAGTIGAKDGLGDHVEAKHLLLVLDNFEQVLDAARELGELLRRCANLKLLVTSRAPLRVSGEREYQVDPLPETDAGELFTERARAVLASFQPDPAVVELCRRLDGLPLAIELAAARVRILSPEQLLARLERRLPLLTGGAHDAPERQRTLRATIEWSHDLLDAEAQGLFARLAVFAGSFDLEAAEAVCAASLDQVEALVEQSLIRRWASGRLGMLETIREFALERLAVSGELEAVARAHAEHFLALVESGEKRGANYTPEWRSRFEAERDNCRAAMRWALDGGKPLLALRMTIALGPFWVVRSAHQEANGWLTEAIEATPDAPKDLRARALRELSTAPFLAGDYTRAAALGEEALTVFRELGDKPEVALTLDMLSAPVGILGDPARARALTDESLALCRELGDRERSLYPLSKVALDEWQRGDRELAIALTEQTIELAREVGDTWWEAGQVFNLADMLWEQGELSRAAVLARESLSLAHELGSSFHLIYLLALLAALAAADGDAARAGRLWGAAETLEESGEAVFQPGDRDRYAQPVFALSGAELEASLAEGRAMTLDEAVALALDSLG